MTSERFIHSKRKISSKNGRAARTAGADAAAAFVNWTDRAIAF